MGAAPQLKINSTVIKEVDEIKFLGVILDKKLSFDNHINYLCKKLSCCIVTLKRMRHFMPKELKLTLYHTLFESHLVEDAKNLMPHSSKKNIQRHYLPNTKF